MKKLGIGIVTLFLLLACAGQQKVIQKPVSEKPVSPYDESFDPMSLHDDDISVQPGKNKPSSSRKTKVKKSDQADSETVLKERDGFRVQILATRSIETATMVKQQAEEQFKPYGYKVYWQFEAPFYKIRVGDVIKRTDAENIRDLAKELGYDQAFPVRSKVKVSVRSY